MSSKKFRIRKRLNVGSPDAETDEILFNVFIENDTVKDILDTKSHKSILLGRTGSGKSAVIKYIEKECKRVTRIEPETLSLRYLSNSTIIRYFRDLNINLNLFFKVLWKHVFVVELLKLYFPNDYSKERKVLWIDTLRESIRKKIGKVDPKKEKALNYLDNWTDKFWQDTEYRIKEIENTVSKKFKASAGISIEQLKSTLESESANNDRSLSEIRYKAESVIHEIQSNELIEIFTLMKNGLFVDHQKKFYIVIDDLDKEWIETSFRYDLIDAMVEVIKEITQFKGVKIVVSLRENLNELLKLGIRHEGGQREKFKPLYADLNWGKHELTQLIDKRLKSISEDQLDVKSAFYEVRRTGEKGLDYVLRRTYMRPRDIISFVNHAISKADNSTYFTKDIIHTSEIKYSTERFNALEDEWRENYGEIYPICKFLNGMHNAFKLRSINENSFEDIYFDENIESTYKGSLLELVDSWKKDQIKFTVFTKRIIFLLYHIGIIGVKKGPTFTTAFYYDDISITKEDISNNNTYYIHPSLFSHFKINTMEQLPEN